jgi:hypothetical protein
MSTQFLKKFARVANAEDTRKSTRKQYLVVALVLDCTVYIFLEKTILLGDAALTLGPNWQMLRVCQPGLLF